MMKINFLLEQTMKFGSPNIQLKALGRSKLNACTGIETRQNNNGGESYALSDCETDSGRSFSFPKIR